MKQEIFLFTDSLNYNMNNKITIVEAVTLVGIMTLSLLAVISSINQAWGQTKTLVGCDNYGTRLTVSLNPDRNKGGLHEGAPTTVSGRLTCYDDGLPGKIITIDGGNGVSTAETDSSGHYSKSYLMFFTACTMAVKVHYSAAPQGSAHPGIYGAASASALYHLERLSAPCPT